MALFISMSNRTVIGLTGRTGTGKTTVAAHLKDRWGFGVFEGSELLRGAARADGLVLDSRDSYERYYRRQQETRGASYLADIMLASDAERVVHCGLRSPADQLRIKQAGGVVVTLVCPPEICVSRIDIANPKNPSNLEEYVSQQALQDSSDDRGSHLTWVIANADHVVDTSGNLEETFASIDGIVGQLLK